MIIVESLLADVAFVLIFHSSAKTNAFAEGEESLFGAVIANQNMSYSAVGTY